MGSQESVMTEQLHHPTAAWPVECTREDSTTLLTVTVISEPLSSLLSIFQPGKPIMMFLRGVPCVCSSLCQGGPPSLLSYQGSRCFLKGRRLSSQLLMGPPSTLVFSFRPLPKVSCLAAKSWQLFANPYCSAPGFPVLHYLPEFSQTHVH